MGLGDFVKGAGGGALAGGSIGGPWGALIGGGLGGVLGAFGGNDAEDQKNRWLDFQKSLDGQKATLAQDSPFRADQAALVQQLQAMANGTGPSLATQQLKMATDRNIAQQQAMAQSGQGNATMAAQGAAMNAGRLGAQASQDSAAARMAEQMNAIGSLGSLLQGARQQDLGLGMFNADAQNSLAARLLQARMAALGGLQGTVQPALSDQLLAGGAGMFSMGASQRGLGAAGQQGQPSQVHSFTNPNIKPY